MTSPAPPPAFSPASDAGATAGALEPNAILDFWFADGLRLGWPSQDMNARWFGAGAVLDADIKARFGELVLQGVAGGLTHWEPNPNYRLALIILLDQFTRNVFRGDKHAFDGDTRARQLVLRTLESGEDQSLSWVAKVFVYMPLMHAEVLELQEECVARFSRLVAYAPEDLKQRLQGNLDFARQHRDIIARFGRFPYRNAVLGRSDTPQEGEFLLRGPRFGQ